MQSPDIVQRLSSIMPVNQSLAIVAKETRKAEALRLVGTA
jgi:hypothetical protein